MEKIIDRIRKLLALASNNTSEAERESALAKAHAMLLQHNLAMSDVAGDEAVEETVEPNTQGYKLNAYAWARWIAAAIGELYFCRFYWSRNDKGKIVVTYVGSRADADVAHAVMNMVVTDVLRGAAQAVRENPDRSVSSVRTDFLNAAGRTIYWRCKELRKRAERGETVESDGRALVVASLYQQKLDAAQAWMDKNVTLNKPRKTVTVNRYSAAAEAGRAAGAKVPLTMSLPK